MKENYNKINDDNQKLIIQKDELKTINESIKLEVCSKNENIKSLNKNLSFLECSLQETTVSYKNSQQTLKTKDLSIDEFKFK